MDDFVYTAHKRKGDATHLRPIQLALANSCRLYLRVTWLSEIVTADGKHIAPWFFFGRRRSTQTTIVYPYQPDPPAHAWKEWRIMLITTYMAAARVDMQSEYIPIHNQTLTPFPVDDPIPPSWPPHSRYLSLTDIIARMPDVWRQAVGTVELPVDDGEDIAEILRSGSTIRAWSDGSVASGIGAHAYTIRSFCTGTDNHVSGDAVTPGHPDTISSLRSEHYGALAILLIVLAIEWKYSLEATGYIVLHIDNMEVVNRTKFGVPMSMSAHFQEEYF